MAQRPTFEPAEHTDYIVSVVVDDWRPILLILALAIVLAGIAWWVRRRRKTTE